MGIQDLGAIGEFISSLVIVVTLMVLIYEVRGSKRAALQANAQERQRLRDDVQRSVAESPDLARIMETANQHLGVSRFMEHAADFGLQPEELIQLTTHYARVLFQLRNAYLSGLPDDELQSVDQQIRALFAIPSYVKWHELQTSVDPREGPWGEFLDHVDEVRATL